MVDIPSHISGVVFTRGAAFYVHQQREDLKVCLPKKMVNHPPDKVFVTLFSFFKTHYNIHLLKSVHRYIYLYKPNPLLVGNFLEPGIFLKWIRLLESIPFPT